VEGVETEQAMPVIPGLTLSPTAATFAAAEQLVADAGGTIVASSYDPHDTYIVARFADETARDAALTRGRGGGSLLGARRTNIYSRLRPEDHRSLAAGEPTDPDAEQLAGALIGEIEAILGAPLRDADRRAVVAALAGTEADHDAMPLRSIAARLPAGVVRRRVLGHVVDATIMYRRLDPDDHERVGATPEAARLAAALAHARHDLPTLTPAQCVVLARVLERTHDDPYKITLAEIVARARQHDPSFPRTPVSDHVGE